MCQGATCCWPCQYPSIIKTFYCHVFSEELASTVITWQECTRNNVLQETHVWELQKVYHIELKNRFSIRSFLNFYIINALNRQNLDKANQTSFIISILYRFRILIVAPTYPKLLGWPHRCFLTSHSGFISNSDVIQIQKMMKEIEYTGSSISIYLRVFID